MKSTRRVRATALAVAIAMAGGLLAMVEPASAAPAGTINGTVTLPAGTTAQLQISAYRLPLPAGAPVAAAVTSRTGGGDWTLSGLTAGDYLVAYVATGADGVAGAFRGGGSTVAGAPAVTLAAGTAVTGIDDTLTVGGSVTGVVSAAGGPAQGVCVSARPPAVLPALEMAVGGLGRSATTDATGTYRLTGLRRSHYLLFLPCEATADGLAPSYSGGARNDWAATVYDPVAGATATVNATLAAAGVITGTVQGPSGPLAGICVDAYDGSDIIPTVRQLAGQPSWTTTAADGTYRLAPLQAGNVKVNFYSCNGTTNVSQQFWNGSATLAGATPVAVAAGQTVAGISPTLTTGGTLVGSFQPAPTIAGGTCNLMTVEADGSVSGDHVVTAPGGALTDFVFTGLRPGSWRLHLVCTAAGATVMDRWYDGRTQAGTVDRVTVTAGATTAVVFHLDDVTPPTIAGTTTNPANAAGWFNTSPTVRFTCADVDSGLGSCPADVVVSTEGAGEQVTRTASDRAGNSASATVTVNIDRTPPSVSLSGAAASYTTAQTVTIACTATDSLSGIATSTCAPYSVPAASLGVGTRTLNFSATDRAGNTTSRSATFTVTAAVVDPLATLSAAKRDQVLAFYRWVQYLRWVAFLRWAAGFVRPGARR